MHAPFVFSSIQPYLPFAIAVFFFLFRVCMGLCLSPTLHGVCHTLALLQAFPSSSTVGEVVPHLPSPASLFIYSSVRESPYPTLWSSGHPVLFATCPFFFQLLVYYSVCFFSFFSWVGGSFCPGDYADLDHVLLRSPGHLLLPSRLGASIWWWHGSPPGFSV
jgi:hypothetical protein